ncbi:MAG TPA: amidohydrolase [Chthoniobacterales bacterium]|nr:amidohydrolase [Chthoniobacterales bacterium]
MTLRLLLALTLVPALSAFAEPTPSQLTEAELPSLLTIFKDLHTHPELSGHEEKTSALVAKELKATGCEVTDHLGKYEKPGMTGYGVVGVMKNGDGPTVLVRTDLDGLPVTEETGVPYASKDTTTNDEGKQVGVMHACGHDIHMSTFLGVARNLSKLKSQWKGTIVFLGQPAEETGSGAKAMLADGLYTRFPKPDFVVGLHDSAQMETGKVGVTEGYIYANVDSVDVTVKGAGGHGAYPHKTKDPVVLAAEIIQGWQTIVSREVDPIDSAVVTVGSIQGGTKHNIIPDEVKMQLTVRSYKKETRDKVLAAIARIAKGMAEAAGMPADRMPVVKVLENEFTPSTYNNPELTKRVVASLKNAVGADKFEATEPTMGGEDFSIFSLPDHSIPACMFTVGGVEPAKMAESKKNGTALPSLHSSKFAPVPESTIRAGMIGMTGVVLDLLKK